MSGSTERVGSDELDVTDVLHAAKSQYSGDKVFHMTRRMSGMPLFHRLNKGYVDLDAVQAKRFNDLLDRFPDPPVSGQNPQLSTVAPSINKNSGGGWGSFGRLAEKFNVFNKNS